MPILSISLGYQGVSSCETTLINLVEDWRLVRDQRQVMSILSTDMSKAFDSLHPPLVGNLKKYQVLNLGFIQNDSSICVNNVEIKTKGNIILLGVVLDSKLNFSEHIISICKKASQRIGVLMRLRNLIPMKSKLTLFKSAILPFLAYCHLVWHFRKASNTRKHERLQERGLRAVFKDNNSSYEQSLEKADLTTLQNRCLQDLCILMYKVKHKLCPALYKYLTSFNI